ncbi:MAG: hypothetical protein Q3985_01380 [Eubacteriales bacterium]|nr:hypothetical protein [Eubacteriales bacterium]
MEFLVIVIIIAVVVILSKNKNAKQSDQNMNYYQMPTNTYNSLQSYDVSAFIRTAPPADPNTGYSNLPTYIVKGKRKTTNRWNTREYATSDPERARQQAYDEGLIEPLEVRMADFQPPHETNGNVPQGASQWDVWEMTNSADADDSIPMSKGFWDYATAMDIHVSWFTGRNTAAARIFTKLADKDRVILYGYAVHCSLTDQVMGNVLISPNYDRYESFAAEVMGHPDVMKSIMGRPGSDLWKPSKQTIAYSFAVKFFCQ